MRGCPRPPGGRTGTGRSPPQADKHAEGQADEDRGEDYAPAAQVTADGGELDRLRRLAQLTGPAEDDVREASAALRRAASGLDAVAGSLAGRARALAGLLTAALQHHDVHGDGDCPVCGRPGALTGQWRQGTEQEVTRLSQEPQAAESAERAAAGARQHAAVLLLPPPPVLAEEPPPGVDPGPVRAAWKIWAQPPDAGTPTTATALRSLADHLDQVLAPLTQELRSLSAQATAQYSEREDARILVRTGHQGGEEMTEHMMTALNRFARA